MISISQWTRSNKMAVFYMLLNQLWHQRKSGSTDKVNSIKSRIKSMEQLMSVDDILQVKEMFWNNKGRL